MNTIEELAATAQPIILFTLVIAVFVFLIIITLGGVSPGRHHKPKAVISHQAFKVVLICALMILIALLVILLLKGNQ